MFERQPVIKNNFIFAIALAVSIFLLSSVAQAQQLNRDQTDPNETTKSQNETTTSRPDTSLISPPAYTELLGVRLGMSAAEVRAKVAKLKDKGPAQDFFVFSDKKSAQVYYDAEGRVRALSIDYVGIDSGAPLPEKVIGEALQPKPDGSMHELRRYPEDGYWIAYSRTAGSNPTTTVTIQML